MGSWAVSSGPLGLIRGFTGGTEKFLNFTLCVGDMGPIWRTAHPPGGSLNFSRFRISHGCSATVADIVSDYRFRWGGMEWENTRTRLILCNYLSLSATLYQTLSMNS